MLHEQMSNEYLNNWTTIANQLQKPYKELIELNAKTFQDLKYLKPEDFQQVKKPEELMEKQMQVCIQNGHKMLNYLQEVFLIIENNFLGLVKKAHEQANTTAQNFQEEYAKNYEELKKSSSNIKNKL